MIRNAELCSPTSCINSAQPDEPVFVLRAHDPVAPEIVRAWAKAYLASKISWQHATPAQRVKYQEALTLAQQMDDYARAQGWRP